MTDFPPFSSDDTRDQAAAWFARLNSGHATEADRLACEAWRAADPEHDRQYRNQQFFWEAARHVPQARLRALLNKTEDENDVPRSAIPPQSGQPRSARRRFGLGLAGVCALAVTAGASRHAWWDTPDHVEELATARGERRTVTLPEGSVIYLNTGTRATVRLYEGRRVVELAAGEAMFEVSHDSNRPFIVDADHTEVRVTGTRFNVRYDPDGASQGVNVSVASGSVQVSAGPWWNRKTRNLTAGQGVSADAADHIGQVVAVDASQVMAWQRGKIVFDNAPLARVVDEMNRYLPAPAVFSAPAQAQYRVAGVFSIDDPLAMMNALPAIAPVRVLRMSDGRLQVVDR